MRVMLALVLAALAAAAPTPTPTSTPTPHLDAATDALIEEMIVRALQRDGRLDVVEWERELITNECVRDAACLSRRGDAMEARYVMFGYSGRVGPTTVLALDAYDARTGLFAGRETMQASTEQDLTNAADGMVAAVLGRLLAATSTGGRVVFLGVLSALDVTPPEERERTLPFGLIGSAGVLASGVAMLGASSVLLLLAFERDQAALAAHYQIEAGRYEEQRNLYALAALMTTTMAGGATLLAVMGATWAVFVDDEP